MFIKLEYTDHTEKAYQLSNGSWIPKSVLDTRGLEHPYYQIKDWWLTIQVENIKFNNEQLKNMRAKYSESEKIESEKVMLGLKPLIISIRDIPSDVMEIWRKYWKGLNIGGLPYDPTDRKWEISEWDLGYNGQ